MHKFIISHFKKYFLIYIAVSIMILIEFVLAILPTKIIQQIIKNLEVNKLEINDLNNSIILFLIVAMLSYILSALWHIKLLGIAHKYKMEIKDIIFNKILSMKSSFFNKFKPGDIFTIFSNDIDNVANFLGRGVMAFLFSIIVFALVAANMWIISYKVTIFSIFLVLIGGIILHYISEKQDIIIEKRREVISKLNDEVLDIVEGVRVVRAYSSYNDFSLDFKNKTQDLMKQENYINYFELSYAKLFNIIFDSIMIVIVFFGSKDLLDNRLLLSDIVALTLYTSILLTPMWSISLFVSTYLGAKVSISKISNLLDENDGVDKTGTLKINEFNKFELKNYSFKYKDEYVLKDINLIIKKGETLGIVGKIGSGKTTLIKQLLRFFPQGEGDILINDLDIKKYDIQNINNLVSYVSQDSFLFSKSIKENLLVAEKNASDEEMIKVLEDSAFAKDLSNLDNGIDTIVGERGVNISGGQKQRISIARSFLKNSEILILDDAFSALDVETEEEILTNIKKYRKNKTNIIISHRLSAVKNSDMIIVLEDGKIVEKGNHYKLIENKKWYFQQHLIQNKGEKYESNN